MDARVNELALETLAPDALLVNIARQLGLDVKADIESLRAKLAIRLNLLLLERGS